MALEKELETYKAKLPELKGSEGKFVLIKGAELVDTFTSYEDAIKEGYARFHLEPFLVKQVQSSKCNLSHVCSCQVAAQPNAPFHQTTD